MPADVLWPVNWSIAGVFAASVAYLGSLFAPKKYLKSLGNSAAVLSLVLLTVAIGLMLAHEHLPPLATGRQAFSLIAWALLAVQVAQAARWDLPAIGAAVAPLALAALFVATALPGGGVMLSSQAAGGLWIHLHVASIVCSIVLLLLSGSCAGIWLLEHRMLKTKRIPYIFRRYPPLEVVDNLAYQLAAVGFAALSVGVLTATVWAAIHPSEIVGSSVAVRLTAAASWAIYAVYLWARRQPFGRGAKSNWILVAGCLAILLTTSLHRFLIPGLIDHAPAKTHAGAFDPNAARPS